MDCAGYRFGATDLGFFNRGQQLCYLAHYWFLMPITEVGFALLCRLKADSGYREAYIALARRVAAGANGAKPRAQAGQERL